MKSIHYFVGGEFAGRARARRPLMRLLNNIVTAGRGAAE